MRGIRTANKQSRNRRRGTTILEFTLLGIPAICLFTSVMTCSIDMWQLFTLSYAVEQTARYAAMHGLTCSQNGNTCTITRANVATFFQSQALALAPASTTLIMDDGGTQVTCNPVTACPSSSSQFPSVGHNLPTVPDRITVKATYQLMNPIFMFWPGVGGSVSGSRFTVGATSTQPVIF